MPDAAQCVLIADDLTGACDAAAPFAASGLRTVVPLANELPPSDVVAFSTGSRDVDPAEARRRLCAVAARVTRLAPRVLFKKIDSTLRGNTGREIVAALEVFGCDAAVVNPAFPAMGRTVESGVLTAGPGFSPIHLPSYLEEHGADACRHVRSGAIEAAIAEGARYLTMDDLDEIAAELLTVSRRVLWAGSAGLARALAARLGGPARPRPDAPARGPVLFCIGSDHRVTVEQERRLRSERLAPVLRIPRWDLSDEEVRSLLGACRPAAIVLSGGDTAELVCRAIGAGAIDLAGEFSPGIAMGTLRGGMFDGVAVVTKSGGFGGPDALIEIADYFHG